MKRTGQAARAVSLAVVTMLVLALPQGAAGVTVTSSATSADNEYWLFMDGGDGAGNSGPSNWAVHGDEWRVAETASFSLTMGQTHSVAVKAINHDGTGANPAAFLGQLDAGSGNWFLESSGRYLLTEASWEVWYGGEGPGDPPDDGSNDPAPPSDGTYDWWERSYDTSAAGGWGGATEIATNGTSGTAWYNANNGPVAGISEDAYWIWTSNWERDRDLSFDGQDVDSPVYLRATFTPVPEPLTMAGVLAGVAGIGAYLRKRRREA